MVLMFENAWDIENASQRYITQALVSKAKSFTLQPHTKNEKSAMAVRDEASICLWMVWGVFFPLGTRKCFMFVTRSGVPASAHMTAMRIMVVFKLHLHESQMLP